jgi:hypothetical protein
MVIYVYSFAKMAEEKFMRFRRGKTKKEERILVKYLR